MLKLCSVIVGRQILSTLIATGNNLGVGEENMRDFIPQKYIKPTGTDILVLSAQPS